MGHSRRIAIGLITMCLTTTLLLLAVPALQATALVVNHPIVGMAATPDGGGYWEVASDGGIFAFGDAGFYGSEAARRSTHRSSGWQPPPMMGGYWEVASDGGIFAFGDAGFFGSEGGQALNAPIVGMAPPPTRGRLLGVASDGGIFAFGDAGFYGSEGGQALNAPIVGMAASASGHGYWLVASDGGIFSFGDAAFWGSTGSLSLNRPIVGMAAIPSGHGYWLVGADGGIFSFGDAAFWGSAASLAVNRPIVGMAPTPGGYWEVASDGGIFGFGNAPFLGSVPELPPPGPPRIALYGDSLVSEAGQDFAFLASNSGASVQSALSQARQPVTSSHRWQPTLRTGSPPWRCWHFQGTPSPRAWLATSLEPRSTTRSTRTTLRRPSRSSGPSAPRSSWSVCHLTRPPASVKTPLPSTRSTNRWPRATSVLLTTMPAKQSWRTDSSPGLFHASWASRAWGQPGQHRPRS